MHGYGAFAIVLVSVVLLALVGARGEVCEDEDARCGGEFVSGLAHVASPLGQFSDVSNETWDVPWWSGSGLCGDVGPPVLRDWFRAKCKRSCGICSAECADTLHGDGALDSDARCALLIASHGDICYCDGSKQDCERVTETLLGPLSVLYVRNKCLKSCSLRGGLFGGGAPCVPEHGPDATRCELPFQVGATIYTAPITVATLKPARYSELMAQLGRAENLTDLWCPRFRNHDGTAWDPATAEIVFNPGPQEIATLRPTASPTQTSSPTQASASCSLTGSDSVVCNDFLFPDIRFADGCVPDRVRARLESCIRSGIYDCDLQDVVPSDGIVWLDYCDDPSMPFPRPRVFPVISRTLHVFSSAHDATSPLRLRCDRRLYFTENAAPVFLVNGGVNGVTLTLSNVSVSDCGGSVALLYGFGPRFKAFNSVFERCGSFENDGLGGVVTVGIDREHEMLLNNIRAVDPSFSEYVVDAAVEFTNCTLRYNRARSGGVLLFAYDLSMNSLSTLQVTDSRIVGNTAQQSGGVVSFTSGRVEIQRSEVSWNVAGVHGGVAFLGTQGMRGTGLFESTAFSNNRAERGGVLYMAGINLMESAFLSGRQNAYMWFDTPFPERCNNFSFVDSALLGNSVGADGGALWIDQNGNNVVVMERCIVANNSANANGGAAFVKGTAAPLPQLVGSRHYQNGITSASLYFEATRQWLGLTLRDSSIMDNSALGTGGAVCAEPFTSLLVSSSTASGNMARLGGFCAIASTAKGSRSELELRGVTIERNRARAHGGALHVGAGAEVTASNCTLRGNVADDMGGAAFVNAPGRLTEFATLPPTPSPTAFGEVFTQTWGNRTEGELCFDTQDTSCLHGLYCNSIHRCVAAPVVPTERTLLTLIRGTALVDNRASSCGGAVAVEGDASVVIDAASLSGNTAAQGGALCAGAGSSATLFESVLEGNAALTRGGAVYLASGAGCWLNASLLALNSAGKLGGAIAVEYGAYLVVLNSTARSNKLTAAGVGGAVGVEFSADCAPNVSISRSTFDGNLALFGNDVGVDNATGLSLLEQSISSLLLTFNAALGGGRRDRAYLVPGVRVRRSSAVALRRQRAGASAAALSRAGHHRRLRLGVMRGRARQGVRRRSAQGRRGPRAAARPLRGPL
jgi:hypothetical protein